MFLGAARFLIMLCLFNVFFGAVSFGEIREKIDGIVSAQHRASLEKTSIIHPTSDPAQQPGDCDDEGCAHHQCHFGHCQVVMKRGQTLHIRLFSRQQIIVSTLHLADVFLSDPAEPPRT